MFVCSSTSLRPRALRPQLKRDPLGGGHLQDGGSLRHLLQDFLVLLYLSAGVFLRVRSSRYLRDPQQPRRWNTVFDQNLYSDAGQGPRLAVIWFYYLGTIVLIVGMWLLSR